MQVRVYNDNIYPFTQMFKGDKIHIPPKEYVMMEDDDAMMFKGLYSPIQVDGANNHLPQSFKMVRVVFPNDYPKEPVIKKNQCHACNKNFDSPELLDDHVTEMHLDSMADKEEKEKRQKAEAAKQPPKRG